MKSAKTSTMVFPFGSCVLICSFISAGNPVGEIINFHLAYRQQLAKVNALQPLTISSSGTRRRPGNPARSRRHRNCRRGRNTTRRVSLRTQDSECSGTYPLLVTIHYSVRNRKKYLPRNRLDLRDFSGIQQGIRGTTERSPNVESDDEFSRKASVTGAGCFHNGSRRKAIDKVRDRPPVGAFKYFPRRHTFPLHNGDESRPRAGHTSRLIPSRTRTPHLILLYAVSSPSSLFRARARVNRRGCLRVGALRYAAHLEGAEDGKEDAE